MDSKLLHQLALRIREIEANQRPSVSKRIALLPGLDRDLPGGALVELLAAAEGSGSWTLALLMGKQACGERNILVIADEQRCFYPPAAVRLGIDLRRLLVIRSQRRADILSALVQSLRCSAVGAAIGRFERLTAAEYRSLQLAAETGSGMGFLLRPVSALRAPSFAVARLLITPMASTGACRRVRVEVVRNRGGKTGHAFVLEIDDETGHVCLSAPVAAATTGTRPARASG
jgi:protein ImuA